MSIHFFDSHFEPYINYGTSKSAMLSMLASKTYRGRGSYAASALNQTISKIVAADFSNGTPKILIVFTDGGSYDSALEASNYARTLGITLICVAIGSNIKSQQLILIAQTHSNIIAINDFSDLPKLVAMLSNLLCKQIADLSLH